MKKNRLVAPVLKWVGGKRQLISDIEPLIPKKDFYLCRAFYWWWCNIISSSTKEGDYQ